MCAFRMQTRATHCLAPHTCLRYGYCCACMREVCWKVLIGAALCVCSKGRERNLDIISMLVGVYGSKELFINEYRCA